MKAKEDDNRYGFEIAEIYSNYIGSYMVLSIDGKSMLVEYVDGQKSGYQQNLDMAGQAKVIRNRHLQEMREMKMRDIDLSGHDESFTLGFLARRAFVCVRVKESSRCWFEETHKRLTGREAPQSNMDGNYYNISSDDVKGSGDYFHIGFQTPPDEVKSFLSFGTDDAVHWDVFGTVSKYNNMNYVLNLLRLGFRVGKGHDASVIREKVEDKDAFDRGYLLSYEEATLSNAA